MPYRRSMISRVSAVALPYLIVFSFFPGSILSADVTLKSFELYNTHEWIPRKPAIGFQCYGENRTLLPDIEKPDVLYNFKGEESWQPLTKLLTAKCKRCGIYEKLIGPDHVFDEWELCPSDFATPEGQYTRSKENDFNVTFLCKECFSVAKDSQPADSQKVIEREKHVIVPILVTIIVVAVVASITVAGCKYWKKRKRQQEQARFLKLFEEDDDIEGEFGLTEMV